MNLLPDYWMERPESETGEAASLAFDRLLESTLARGENPLIHYALPAPKWQFLCHVAERYPIVFHGSGNPNIVRFEPRQSNDLNPFGNQRAVYAASDGIWAMFFAIVDRDQHVMSVNNACIRLVERDGKVSGPFYVFSVSRPAIEHQPWRTGTVYLLPGETFTPQDSIPFGPGEVRIAQLASPSPVRPLARLAVSPGDFPFLKQIRGHDDSRLQEYSTALQTGAPWPDD